MEEDSAAAAVAVVDDVVAVDGEKLEEVELDVEGEFVVRIGYYHYLYSHPCHSQHPYSHHSSSHRIQSRRSLGWP